MVDSSKDNSKVGSISKEDWNAPGHNYIYKKHFKMLKCLNAH